MSKDHLKKSPSLCTSNCTSKYIHIYKFSKNEFCESRVQERRLLVTFWMRRLYLVHASRQSCIVVVLKRILYFMSAYSRAMCKPNYNAHHTLLSDSVANQQVQSPTQLFCRPHYPSQGTVHSFSKAELDSRLRLETAKKWA